MPASSPATVLALIPARGGSVRVPRKNLQLVAGKPLIAWTIEAALACKTLHRVVVSTDDEEIKSVALQYGAEVPFLRPKELAQDDTTDFPVLKHALEWLQTEGGYTPEAVVWLRPTTPLRLLEDIQGAVKLFFETRASRVRSVCKAEHHPYWMKTLDEQGKLLPFVNGFNEQTHPRSQLLPPVYRLNGVVDVLSVADALREGRMFGDDLHGYVMPEERSIDIDTASEMQFVDFLLRNR